MKKLISLLSLFITACIFFSNTGLNVQNLSHDWEILSVKNNSITFNNHKEDISVTFPLGATLYNASLTQFSCEHKKNIISIIPITISTNNENNNLNILYNPLGFSFIKNEQSISVLLNFLYNNDVQLQDGYYDISNFIHKDNKFCINYKSPLICGELENVKIILSGIVVNKKLLEPIVFRLNFDNPQSIPLYGN